MLKSGEKELRGFGFRSLIRSAKERATAEHTHNITSLQGRKAAAVLKIDLEGRKFSNWILSVLPKRGNLDWGR